MIRFVKNLYNAYKLVRAQNSYKDDDFGDDITVDYGRIRLNLVGAISRLPCPLHNDEQKELSKHLNYTLGIVDKIILRDAGKLRWYDTAPYHMFSTLNVVPEKNSNGVK